MDDWGTNYPTLHELDEISDDAAKCSTAAGKLWNLLFNGHQAMYDSETLGNLFEQAGFAHRICSLHEGTEQIVKETHDMQPELSLIMEGVIV